MEILGTVQKGVKNVETIGRFVVVSTHFRGTRSTECTYTHLERKCNARQSKWQECQHEDQLSSAVLVRDNVGLRECEKCHAEKRVQQLEKRGHGEALATVSRLSSVPCLPLGLNMRTDLEAHQHHK